MSRYEIKRCSVDGCRSAAVVSDWGGAVNIVFFCRTDDLWYWVLDTDYDEYAQYKGRLGDLLNDGSHDTKGISECGFANAQEMVESIYGEADAEIVSAIRNELGCE